MQEKLRRHVMLPYIMESFIPEHTREHAGAKSFANLKPDGFDVRPLAKPLAEGMYKGALGGALPLHVRPNLWRLPQKNESSLSYSTISYNLPVGLKMARYIWQIW